VANVLRLVTAVATLHRAAERALQLARDRYFTPTDTLERHLIVARLLGSPRTVVDVGGDRGRLAGALPGVAVTAVNVQQPADLIVDPGPLPFRDRAIRAVTSLDTLEHIPPADRASFVAELVRVCDERLVLCCPLGGPEHAAGEREMQAWHVAATGAPHPWLQEHLDNGLPELADLKRMFAEAVAPGDRVTLRFHGDFRGTNEQFKAFAAADPRSRARHALVRLRYEPDLALREQPDPWVNRVFVLVERAPLEPARSGAPAP
jgi:hypothetical protein